MVPLKDNVDLECFLVTKHSWKGKYKRILAIGTAGVSTYNPDKIDITNRWAYSDVISVGPNKAAQSTSHEFVLIVRKDRKHDTIRLSSEFRNEILTSLFRFHKEFAEKIKTDKYSAYKYHWSGISLPTQLEITPCSLDQLDPTSNKIIASYNFKDIEGIVGIKDYDQGIVICGNFTRLHLFRALNHHEIVQNITHYATQYMNVDIKVVPSQVTLSSFEQQKFGLYAKDEYMTSMTEFIVHKISERHPEPTKRFFCLTQATILERDTQTYSICTLRPLQDIFALIRDSKNAQLFTIEYKNGLTRSYLTNDRDSLLATLLDAVRSNGNQNVHVRSSNTPRSKRLVPLHASVDEETEANLLRLVFHNFQYPIKRFEILERFNANISYSGLNYSVTQESLFAENKEKLILGALQALTSKETENTTDLSNLELEATFHVLRRLLASKVGFAAFTNVSGFREAIGKKVVGSLNRRDLAVTYAAIDMLNSLMNSMCSDFNLKQEQLNKSSLLSSKQFLANLLDMWTEHVNLGSGALILSAMLDFLTFGLCAPYSETTDGKQFDILLEMVACRGRAMFKLFQHPSLAIVKGAGLVMRALIEEGDQNVATQMQTLALDEAALLKHLLVALYTPMSDTTMAAHRQLSRHLVGLWITDNDDAMQLLKRIFPAGLLMFLEATDEVPKNDIEEDKLNFRDNLNLAIEHSNRSKRHVIEKHLEDIKHWGLSLLDRQEKVNQALQNRPIVLRNRRVRKRKNDNEINLAYFFFQFLKDHSLPNLIWNHKTREELRVCLESELRQFNSDKDLSGNILLAWNYEEFEVNYQCLADEIKIGDYYIRLILEKDDWPQNLIKDPIELFNALYRRVLCRNRVNDDQMTVASLQALAKVYKRYHEEIGQFSDMSYILQLLDRCLSPSLRDALVGLVKVLVLNKSNCRPLNDHINCLVDLITLAHLHQNRALPSVRTNVIEAGPNQQYQEDKDWYYNIEKENEKSERCGPVTFSELKELWNKKVITQRTRCWASGMDGWRTLQQLPQLKWCLMAKGQSLFNETELASHVLDILIKCTSFFPSRARDGNAVLIPGPKLSRKLSEFVYLPHIVQVCLTHDPGLLERVANLLCQIMQDNSEMPKVYLTGVFYFMLMYTGSNILPIAHFLKMTHMKQAFGNDTSLPQSEIMNRSILGQLLPEAMVCFLENYSAEKFAEIFLGEFDTPEVIWNSEMRRLLIEKISTHLNDFTPKLRGHIMARYPYLAIPVISYPQLENELFCHIFYLRHLCDTQKFPNWPIAEPVLLLKHTLEAWRKEIDKKPSEMTAQQAYQNLGIDLTKHPQPDETLVRKSYYRLAQIYHPDKNPKGREMFECVNNAYEFLCSRSRQSSGPNPANIVLILRTQSILFDRYTNELRPYKYAGYPQLVKTIQMETKDDQLFSKEVPLLTAACELCYFTVYCSALNAEELRRENGFEALLEAYTRCVSILGVDSKPTDTHYQIISNITKCFEVACNFEQCKNKIMELPQLLTDVCRVIYFKHALSVGLVIGIAANNISLQSDLVTRGVLWSLLYFMFDYDYTLDESGVDTNEKTNQQKLSNNLARLSILAVVAMCGNDMKLVLDADDPLSTAIQSQNVGSAAAKKQNSQTSSAYTSNATNLIQSNSTTPPTNNNSSTFTSYVGGLTDKVSSSEEIYESEIVTPVEKVNLVNGRKYTIGQQSNNAIVKSMIDRLLTKYISDKLATQNESEVLKLLTSNTRNPYLIWDNATRAQLVDFLDDQRTQSAKQQYEDVNAIGEIVSQFEFDAHRDELQIGGIYIRVYNEMPTFQITNPTAFVIDVLEFLEYGFAELKARKQPNNKISNILIPTPVSKRSDATKAAPNISLTEYNRSRALNRLTESKSGSTTNNFASLPGDLVDNVIAALKALVSVIKSNPKVGLQSIGHFETLFGFVSTNLSERDPETKSLGLEIVSLVSRNKECVTEIAACELLGQFLIALKDDELRHLQVKVLETLSGLLNIQTIVKEAQSKGAVIYLLEYFGNSRNPQIREFCAELLAKMTADKLSGPKVRITVCKFLPAVFLDAMTESPPIAVQMFESTHEHPELIWNEKIRDKVIDSITHFGNEFHRNQLVNAKHQWRDPDVLQDITTNELVVAGVYLKLFVKNPTWTLRKPKQFLADLLDYVTLNINKTTTEKDKESLELATSALVALLNIQPNLSDSVPVFGHIPKFFTQLSVQPKSALRVLHQLARSEICVQAISQTECIAPLKKCMENFRELQATACETFSRMFKFQHDALIRQSLDCQLIPYLLNILDSRLEFAENPSMVKAQIVEALKAMTHNLNYGDRVAHLLNSNPIWAQFRDQKHDLFITESNTRGYLTGVTQAAGYLTQGPSKSVEVLTSPPPIERDDPLARQTDDS